MILTQTYGGLKSPQTSLSGRHSGSVADDPVPARAEWAHLPHSQTGLSPLLPQPGAAVFGGQRRDSSDS